MMAKLFVLLLVWHCLIGVHYYHSVSARIQTIYKEEKHEFGGGGGDEQLKIQNKPAAKTFETKEGAKVDCIDINQQPSLDHPLLKNHVIKLRPSSRPKDLSANSLEPASLLSWGDADLGYSCPNGTVPIRRTTIEDQIRENSLLKSSSIKYPNADVNAEPTIQLVAVRHSFNVTPPTPPVIFRGIQGEIKIDNPVVQKDQISASVLWVEGGPTDHPSTIQAGWVVAPSKFGDSHTHLSIYWRNGPGGGNGFDMHCKGFVQVDNNVPIGEVFPVKSEYGGKQYSFVGLLFQDDEYRDWWFSITANGKTFDIGYVPRELVPYLDPANYIAWGGVVKSPPNTPSPQMGNGHLPDGDFNKVSTVWNHKFVDQTFTLVTPQDKDYENHADNPHCYTVQDDYALDHGYSIFFGGPGGKC